MGKKAKSETDVEIVVRHCPNVTITPTLGHDTSGLEIIASLQDYYQNQFLQDSQRTLDANRCKFILRVTAYSSGMFATRIYLGWSTPGSTLIGYNLDSVSGATDQKILQGMFSLGRFEMHKIGQGVAHYVGDTWGSYITIDITQWIRQWIKLGFDTKGLNPMNLHVIAVVTTNALNSVVFMPYIFQRFYFCYGHANFLMAVKPNAGLLKK